jgi:chromosome segregation ATPase
MKTKNLFYFALCAVLTVLSSGCQKTDSSLASENADLKARVQQLEQQLHASQGQAASAQSQAASAGDMQSQLAEAQRKADSSTGQLKSLSSQVDTLKQQIEVLTRQLTEAQQAKENAQKALQLYQDKAGAALKQFQALRGTLNGSTANLNGYHQGYLATQSAVNNSLAALPESRIRRQIVAVLTQFAQVDNIWQTAERQMQARTQEAQTAYNQFVDLGGLGPVDRLVELGQEKILAPVKQENAATAANRDRQMAASEKNLDLAIQNLQAMMNGRVS